MNSYLREPGIVSRANLRRDNGSDDRSRLLMLSSLEGRNDEKVDIAANYLQRGLEESYGGVDGREMAVDSQGWRSSGLLGLRV